MGTNKRPYEDLATHKMETMNDYFMMVILYHMVGFTEVVHDSRLKYNIGTSCVIVTFLLICCNTLCLLVLIMSTTKMEYRKKRAKWNAKKSKEEKYKQLAIETN